MSEPYEWVSFMAMDAGAHINQHTQIVPAIYADQARVTVTFEGTNRARLTLYLPRAELIRVRDTLTEVIAAYDTERAALRTPTDRGVADSAA